MKIFCLRNFLCLSLLVVLQTAVSKTNIDTPDRKVLDLSLVVGVENSTNEVVNDLEVAIRLPIAKTSNQKVLSITSSHSFSIRSSSYGQQVAIIDWNKFKPYSREIVSFIVTVEWTSGSNADLDEMDSKWLLPDQFSQSDSLVVSQLADSLMLDVVGNTKVAENIYQWTTDSLSYTGYVKERKGALHAIEGGMSDCTEAMDTFTALARSLSIPTRQMAGYVIEGSGVVVTDQYHNWAEFYSDGSWQLSDPHKKSFGKYSEVYLGFSILGSEVEEPVNRFSSNDSRIRIFGV